jgi:hypothetical protein
MSDQPFVTFEYLDTPEKQEAVLVKLMASMGFEIVKVGGEELLCPIDATHPDFPKARRKIERARKALNEHRPASSGETSDV